MGGEGPSAIKALERIVAENLAFYYVDLKLAGNITVRFNATTGVPRRFLVSVQERGKERPLIEDQIAAGEAYRFEGDIYLVDETKEGKLQLIRRDLIDSSRQTEVVFPVFIPPEVFEALTTEESAGWERALELAEVTHKGSDS